MISEIRDELPRLSVILNSCAIPSEVMRSDIRFEDLARPKYLPLCSASVLGREYVQGDLTILPTHQRRIAQSNSTEPQCCASWPPSMPLEMFGLITQHLAQDDIENMRLVNRQFERYVSPDLFRTSVVPFNTKLYDMIDGETKGHGLKVFQGFGPYIKRFGMSFNVSESQLSRPPAKKKLNDIEAFHGNYQWPQRCYARFDGLAGLEHTAYETSQMRSALKNLINVQELGLSVDSGLGWLNGPDKSVRALVLGSPSPVFGSSFGAPDHPTQAANELWAAMQQSHASLQHGRNEKEVTIAYKDLNMTPAEVHGLRGTPYAKTQLWSAIDGGRIMPGGIYTGNSRFGVLYTSPAFMAGVNCKPAVVPSRLRDDQQEWLLETGWAQRAFLETYILAIINNPAVSKKVTTLNIAKLSSGLLPLIAQKRVWDALPFLQDVTLHVSPDWQSVAKDGAGLAEMTSKSPSDAARYFYIILHHHVAPKVTIKKLSIGWVGGGEHAEGIFARNSNILPAPIIPVGHSMAYSNAYGLVLKHVEQLTLKNCWMTPPRLIVFVKNHAGHSLEKLTLDSVSLTVNPRFTGAPAGPNFINGPQLLQPQPQPQPLAPWILPLANHAPAQNNAAAQPMQYQWTQAQNQQAVQALANLANSHVGPPMPNHNLAGMPGGPLPPWLPWQPPPQQQAPPNLFGLPMLPLPPALGHWTDGHRKGSWPEVLNRISPGPILSDYPAAPPPLSPRPATELTTIEFVSCGYVKLPGNAVPAQTVLEPWNAPQMTPWFLARQAGLKPSMLETRDQNMGKIVQYMPGSELNALRLAWNLREGWTDRKKAEEAEWDGYLPGGTGRFSGCVWKGMPLVGSSTQAASPS